MTGHASMNRIHRLIWSHARQTWVAVAEIVKGRRKGRSKAISGNKHTGGMLVV